MPPHILYPPAPLEWYCNSTEGIFSDKNSAMSNSCEWFNEGNTKLGKTTLTIAALKIRYKILKAFGITFKKLWKAIL